MSQESQQSLRPAIVMTILAIFALAALLAAGLPTLPSLSAFLSIEGAVLLACSIQPDDPALAKSWRERLLGTGFAEPVGFVPLFYYAGLICLAAGAIVGVFAGATAGTSIGR